MNNKKIETIDILSKLGGNLLLLSIMTIVFLSIVALVTFGICYFPSLWYSNGQYLWLFLSIPILLSYSITLTRLIISVFGSQESPFYMVYDSICDNIDDLKNILY